MLILGAAACVLVAFVAVHVGMGAAASRLERRIYGPLAMRDVHVEVVRWKREPAEREADDEAARLTTRVQGIKVTVVGGG